MTPAQNLVSKIPVVVTTNLSAASFGMLFQIALSRWLDPSTFGAFVASITLLYALSQVFESYSLTVARESTLGRMLPLRGSALVVAIVLGLVTGGAFVFYAASQSLHTFTSPWVFASAIFLLLTWSVLWLLRGSTLGLQMDSDYVKSRGLELFYRFAFGLLIISVFQSLALVLLACALGSVAAAAHLFFKLYKPRPQQLPSKSDKPLGEHMLQFAKMTAGYLPLALFIRLDMIMAPQLLRTEDLGVFGVLNTVGKAVLIYSIALSPLIFPYFVKSDRQGDWLKLLGFGSGISVGLLALVFLVTRFFGESLVLATFGASYEGAGRLLPYYILALIPLAVHCNVINFQLAQGRFATIVVLWTGLAGYYIALRYFTHSITECMFCMAIVHAILSITGLVVSWVLHSPRNPLLQQPRLETGVTIRDSAGRAADCVGSYSSSCEFKR